MTVRRMFRLPLLAAVLPVAVLLAVVLLAGCEKPGEGAKAEEGYSAARPIIASLNTYHEGGGPYPQELEALVPVFLTEVPKGPGGQPFEYRRVAPGDSYSLTFRYTGPGMNVCTYTPETAWRCYGYY